MILEEETFREFGYLPGELKPQSHKRILATCNECGKVRIIRKDCYRPLCTSCGHKGHTPSEETRQKLSEAKHGNKHPNYGKHPSEETRRKISEARKHQILPKHHTKPEMIWHEIVIDKHSLPFKYTGDSSFWIGKKGGEQHNPDFIIKVNGKRYVVEIDGGYWHSPLLNHRLKERRTVAYREKFYKKHGWHPIFIWDTDLLREDAEAFVLNLLKNEGVIK